MGTRWFILAAFVLGACLEAPVSEGFPEGVDDTGSGFTTEGVPIVDAIECKACTRDSDCASSNSSGGCWLTGSSGKVEFCARDCTNNASICPAGTECIADTVGSFSTCVPSSGVCTSDSGSTSTDPNDACAEMAGGWSSFAKGVLTSECAGCHSWSTSYSQVKARRTTIRSEISTNRMPPNGGLSASDKQQIIDWLDCGAPQ